LLRVASTEDEGGLKRRVVVNRRIVIAILVLASIAAWPRLNAQTPSEVTVRALDDQERIAALKRDVPALERLWSDQFVVNAPNNQVVVGKRNVLDTFVGSGVINFSSFERQIEFTRADGDLVTIMGLETVRPTADAPAAGLKAGQAIQRRFTNIWRKEGDTWRLFIRHANVTLPRASR
jgi:ketosteroid isomerase-like protein